MRLKDEEGWQKTVDNNQDPYGKAAVDVARRTMEHLDDAPEDFDASSLIAQADKELDEGITGFQAGCIAGIISQVHERGEEFRQSWNGHYDKEDSDGVVNPAIMTVDEQEES